MWKGAASLSLGNGPGLGPWLGLGPGSGLGPGPSPVLFLVLALVPVPVLSYFSSRPWSQSRSRSKFQVPSNSALGDYLINLIKFDLYRSSCNQIKVY